MTARWNGQEIPKGMASARHTPESITTRQPNILLVNMLSERGSLSVYYPTRGSSATCVCLLWQPNEIFSDDGFRPIRVASRSYAAAIDLLWKQHVNQGLHIARQ